MSSPLPVAIGLDLGTGGARAVAVDLSGELVASGRADIPAGQVRADGPFVEQDPNGWRSVSQMALRQLTETLGRREVVGISVDATSGTFLLVDQMQRPLTPGVMYNDLRATEQTQR